MKALSLWQPWASLISTGAKTIETRSWRTNYTGPIAIHAAKHFTEEEKSICQTQPFKERLIAGGFQRISELPLGAIVAVGRLIGCGLIAKRAGRVTVGPGIINDPDELAFGDYTPGRYGWVIKDVCRLPEPIPYRGQQGLWDLEAELSEQLMGLEKYEE